MWGWSKKLKCQLVHLFGTMVRSVEWQQEAQKKKSLILFLKIYYMSNRINTNASGSGWWWVAGK